MGDLPGIEFMPEPEWSRSNRWLTVILITPEEFGADREAVRLALEAENIEARPVWKPMHLQPVFQVERLKAEGRAKQKRYKTRVVGGSVAPQLNVLKGHGSTGQGGLCYNNNRCYPVRVIGGRVAEDLFNRGLCLPSGTAMTDGDLDRVIDTILNCRPG